MNWLSKVLLFPKKNMIFQKGGLDIMISERRMFERNIISKGGINVKTKYVLRNLFKSINLNFSSFKKLPQAYLIFGETTTTIKIVTFNPVYCLFFFIENAYKVQESFIS